MATQSSILAWEIPWTEEPGSYCPWGCKESDMTEHTQIHSSTFIYGNIQSCGLGGLSLAIPCRSHPQPSFRTSSPALPSDVLLLRMSVWLLISRSLPPLRALSPPQSVSCGRPRAVKCAFSWAPLTLLALGRFPTLLSSWWHFVPKLKRLCVFLLPAPGFR